MKTLCLSRPKAPPQTNEVRSSAALIAGAQVALEYFQRPLVLSELGASAGLNLMWDHYALDIAGQITGPQTPTLTLNPDWTGPCPPSNSINIAEQAGVDLNPLNPRLAPDLLRLTAYLWADQPYRLTLTKAAVATIDVEIEESDAIDWLATRFANLRTGHLHLIENTVAWQYFPNSSQARGLELIEQAGARATAETPLAWFSIENDRDATGGAGAALTLRLRPGDTSLHLGRVNFHGRWVD
jgi:hypothetical protein